MSGGSDEDEVGYGRPPRRTQFKKGQSGNPAGRPRKRAREALDVAAVLSEPIVVESKGKKRAMTPFEVSLRQLVKKALKEQCLRAALSLLRLCEEYGVVAPQPRQLESHVLTLPTAWDWNEWMTMLEKYGAPPWPGPRSGLPERDEEGGQ